MPPVAGIFGIHNHTASLVVELIVLAIGVLWLAMIFWTYVDARRRIDGPLLALCAAMVSLLPVLGTMIYMLVRPPEFLDDVRERELEIKAARARIVAAGVHSCPHCDYLVEREFLRCPNCLRKLRDRCVACGKPLDPDWRVCPYCEADVKLDPALSRRPRRARRDGARARAERSPSDLI